MAEFLAEPAHSHFPTTAWTMILQARDGEAESFRESLSSLCASYWVPVYTFIRGKGFNAEQAADYTQGFFTQVIERQYLADVDRSKGKFRSFLLASVSHFVANRLDADRALKRGGGYRLLQLEPEHAEKLFSRVHGETPETLFEYQWALTILDRTLSRLRKEFPDPEFDQLKPFLVGEADRGQCAATAQKMGISAGALRVAIHRLRQRYREALRKEIADTVENPNQIAQEIQHLIAVLARGAPQAAHPM